MIDFTKEELEVLIEFIHYKKIEYKAGIDSQKEAAKDWFKTGIEQSYFANLKHMEEIHHILESIENKLIVYNNKK